MATVMNSSAERAFLRAREILGKEGALTILECEELEELFEDVNGTQFIALTHAPEYRNALREYDRYLRRPARPIVWALLALVLVSVAMGFYLTG